MGVSNAAARLGAEQAKGSPKATSNKFVAMLASSQSHYCEWFYRVFFSG
jgi:hypothetical protein